MGRATVGLASVGNRTVIGGSATVEDRRLLFAQHAAPLTTTPSATLYFQLPVGMVSMRLRCILQKADTATDTLTVTIAARPVNNADPLETITTTDIDVLGAGPDTWVGVDAAIPLPDTDEDGQVFALQLSLDSSTGTLHGIVLEAVV